MKALDRTDRRILSVLQRIGRITNAGLARRVQLSATPCLERVRRLEREGYIQGYRAKLDPERLGAGLLVFVQVTLDRTTPDVFARFREEVVALPEVQDCHMVAGGFDYLLKIRVRDMAAFRRVLGDGLTALPGVLQAHSYVAMETVKEDAPLSLAV